MNGTGRARTPGWSIPLGLLGVSVVVTILAPFIGRVAVWIPPILAVATVVYAVVTKTYWTALLALLHLVLPFVAVYWTYYLLSIGVTW